jgi:hypothetical protein
VGAVEDTRSSDGGVGGREGDGDASPGAAVEAAGGGAGGVLAGQLGEVTVRYSSEFR